MSSFFLYNLYERRVAGNTKTLIWTQPRPVSKISTLIFFIIRNYLSVEPSKFLKKVPSPALKVS